MFFGLFSTVFGSSSDRFRLVSDRFRTFLQGFHIVFSLFWRRHRRDVIFVVAVVFAVVGGSPAPTPPSLSSASSFSRLYGPTVRYRRDSFQQTTTQINVIGTRSYQYRKRIQSPCHHPTKHYHTIMAEIGWGQTLVSKTKKKILYFFRFFSKENHIFLSLALRERCPL